MDDFYFVLIKKLLGVRLNCFDGVGAGDFDRERFCDGLDDCEGVFGSTAAFAALLEALVRPFGVVEYDGAGKICFLALVLLPPAIVPDLNRGNSILMQ